MRWYLLVLIVVGKLIHAQIASARDNSKLFEQVIGLEGEIFGDPGKLIYKIEPLLSEAKTADRKAWFRGQIIKIRCLLFLGRSAEGQTLAKELIENDDLFRYPEELAWATAVLGVSFQLRGKAEEARKQLERSVELAKLGPYSKSMGYAYSQLAILYYETGKIAESIRSSKLAYQQLESDRGDLYYYTLNNTALPYSRSGDTETVQKILFEALEYFESSDRTFFTGLLLYNIADTIRRNDPKKSLKYFDKAFATAKSIDDKLDMAYVRKGKGLALIALKEHEAATENLRDSIRLFRLLDNRVMSARTAISLAEALFNLREFDAVLESLSTAEEFFKDENEYLLDRVNIYRLKHEAYAQQGMFEAAYDASLKHRKSYEIYADVNRQEQEIKYRTTYDVDRERAERTILEKENEKQSILIYAIGSILGIVSLSWYQLRRRSKVIKSQNRKIENIITHMVHGIILVKSDLSIDNDFSPTTLDLLGLECGQSIKTLYDVLDAIDLSAGRKSTVINVFKMAMGGDYFQWQLNSDQLFNRCYNKGGKKLLDFIWSPIPGSDGTCKQIVIVFKDVTDQVMLELQVKEEVENQSIILNLANAYITSPERLEDFLSQFERLIDGMRQWRLQENRKSQVILALHTVKGNARVLGITDIADLIHDQETIIASLGGFEPSLIDDIIERLDVIVKKYQRQYHVLFKQKDSRNFVPQFKVYRDIIDLTLSQFSYLEQKQLSLGALDIQCELEHANPQLVRDIQNVFLHGLANAIDHGFVEPLKRGEDAPRLIHLCFECLQKGETLLLGLRDNGVGIDDQRVRELCDRTGFKPEEGGSIRDVLLLNAVSTAQGVSKTSGRGAGTAVVKEIADRYNGRIRFLDNTPQGTYLLIELDISQTKLQSRIA
ncbi:ATP-binding protein [Pseudobacteriovorax antillogorgiicola]|uniref:histidine kinase n=1 Tax=Pseudobacteriovorax antillogorgiicola TaxID=1513793 RepID=A0A1Y6CKF2_9BACT|nr:ATP-binding protein [Pseudobacteriovorax antillogorgiicola]TCS48000.1 Hpt domain-containing protein [Pseudobacteriovorax antillogorgiicola]SMF58512.1 Hpt domain-containing protein [Pseudobacteriovorax antillogorgiicola]